MPERPEPNLDRVRRTMREHDEQRDEDRESLGEERERLERERSDEDDDSD
jgi:hypothetical protein